MSGSFAVGRLRRKIGATGRDFDPSLHDILGWAVRPPSRPMARTSNRSPS